MSTAIAPAIPAPVPAKKRDGQVQMLSKGIKDGRISDADFLAIAVKKRMDKKAQQDRENVAPKNKPLQSKPSPAKKRPLGQFDPDACDAGLPSEPLPSMSISLPSPRQILEPLEKRTRKLPVAPSAEEISLKIQQLLSQESGSDLDYRDEDSVVSTPERTVETLDELPEENNQTDELSSLRQLVHAHIIRILNTASFEELTQLRGIGKTRATAILTRRNSGTTFSSLDDLEDVNMSEGAIRRFLQANVGTLLA